MNTVLKSEAQAPVLDVPLGLEADELLETSTRASITC